MDNQEKTCPDRSSPATARKAECGRAIFTTTAQLSVLLVVSSSQQYITHVVQPGKNLFRVALRYRVNWQALAIFNGISDTSLVYVGQIIRVPVS
jgi:LysM repeat protein